jgi:leucyl aminopeptidase
MKITTKNISEETVKTKVIVLPFFEEEPREAYVKLDSLIGGFIGRTINSGEFSANHGQATLLHVSNIKAERLLLIGLGRRDAATAEKIRQAGGKVFPMLRDAGLSDVAVSVKTLDTLRGSSSGGFRGSLRPVCYFLEGGLLGLYKFERYKKTGDDAKTGKKIKSVTIIGDGRDMPLRWLQTVVAANCVARDLINTPANHMTPAVLAATARSLSGRKLKVRVLEKKDAEKEGMGVYLAVAGGSVEPSKFIVMDYKGGRGAPLVLVGKGITFDSGGLSLKQSEGMEKMKYDMAGAAAVLGVMKAVAELALPINLVGIMPATENLPGGGAVKPGDVVTSITGKTVEIINTDAEGRLILADALGYGIKHFRPKAVIDIATLTGACSITFGSEAIAMMGNNDELMERLRRASEETYERVWQMPLYEEYKDYLKSDIADIKNMGGRNGAMLTAAYFLKEFVGDTPWVHLDIAATAFNEKDRPYLPKGASGAGVRLLLNFLKES